jgi:predicted nucleic acid-binding protein
MIIVSDTSPISNLILIERLDILRELFSDVIVPPAVNTEIKALKLLGKDIREFETAEWIRVSKPADLHKVNSLKARLDEGEAEAITLALELKCDLLLMDERIGTRIAREEGLMTVGLVGVLIKAKEQNIIDAVRPILADLKTKAGFWLGENLERKIMEELNEV